MATVSVRVPDDVKERMERHDDVNWSAVIRAHIEDELEARESRSIGHAVATSERLSGAIDPDDVAEQNTADVIREWRNRRYGADAT